MEQLLNIIASSILAIFFIFFFGRNLILKRKLKKSITGKDPFIYITILAFTIIVTLFLGSLWGKLLVITGFELGFLNNTAIKVLAIILMILSTVICITSSLTLRNSWRIGIPGAEKTELIQHGIYSICRNPYFLSYYTYFLAMFLFSANSVIGVGMVIATIPLHMLVIKEERHLENIHGDDYRQYKSHVKRYGIF